MPDNDVRYFWFQGATVSALRDLLNAAGADAILKVNLHGQDATLEVLEPHEAVEGAQPVRQPLNESHPCPPQCL